jgi:hypothetical protein
MLAPEFAKKIWSFLHNYWKHIAGVEQMVECEPAKRNWSILRKPTPVHFANHMLWN